MKTFFPTNHTLCTTLFQKFTLCAVTTLIFFASYTYADAATLTLSPTTGVHTVGSVFSAQVRINTEGKPINAAEATLSFDPQKVTVVSVSKGPIFNLWTADPAFSNAAGTITFGGGSPKGYTGGAGTIMNISFRAMTAGNAKVSFTSGSVLAADGLGTNVLKSMNGAAYTLAANDVPAEPEVIEYVAPANTPQAPHITSISHPDPQGWYTNTTAELSWTIPSGVTAVRTLLDGNSGSIPTKVYDTPINSKKIEDLDEGVSYFHLQFRNANGWGRVAHYRLGVDTQKPTKFDISLPDDVDLSNPTQTLVLTLEDEPSGIARYTVQIDGEEPYKYIDENGSSTIALPPLEPGHHSVIMEAFDRAGNSLVGTFSFDILSFDKPQFTEYPSQINSEVIPVIKGLTRPNADVTIRMASISLKEGSYSAPSEYNIRSNEGGVFTFIPDGRLQNGVYELTAIAYDQQGAQSDPSDAIRIAVQDPGYIQIGSFIVSILSVLVPLVGLVVLLVLILVYFMTRMRKVRRTVVAETEEALAVLDKEFKSLEKALSTQKKNLEKSRKTKKLTRAENDLIDILESEMRKSRKRVAKEIEDVDDIIE